MDLPHGMSEKDWENGNFLISTDRSILREQITLLLSHCHAGALYEPQNAKKLRALRARVAAAKAYMQTLYTSDT